MLPVKSSVENRHPPIDILINANAVPKLVVSLSCEQVSQMFDCFFDFFTDHALVILALICNLNLWALTNIASGISSHQTQTSSSLCAI